MSMRNRIARHGQAAIRGNLLSTPREPLLFLYPTFARRSSTAQSPIEVSTLNQPPPSTSSPPDSTVDASRIVSADIDTSSLPKAAPDGTALPSRKVGARISGPVPTSTPRPQHRNRSKNIQADDAVKSAVERKIHRILSKAQQAKEQEQRKLAIQREWQARRNEELLRPGDPDWRVILQILKETTPQHGKWLAKAITITGSTQSMQRLLLGLDEDIWSIANAYDCSIKLGHRNGSGARQTFVLSGSAVSISKTMAHLLRIVPGIEINSSAQESQSRDGNEPHLNSDGFEDGQNLPDHLRFVIPAKFRDSPRLGEDGLPERPIKWSQFNFYKYVFDLTHFKVHQLRPGPSNNMERSHMSVVRDILHELFTNVVYKHCITSKAIKEAAKYFLNISRINEVRAIFNAHEIKDPELFNLMLERTAKVNDLHNFQFILNLMIRKGFSPNRGTWVTFLNANKSNVQIRLTILSAMKEKGLLQHVLALKEACQVLSITDLEISLSKLESQEEYMNQMDFKFGPDWLSSNTAHRILQVLASRGFISRSCEFLEIMESRFIKPQSFAVNTILQHCNTSRNLGGALEVMNFASRFKDFIPNEETYRILFGMAWQSKNFNLTRVVWKYACLSGEITHRIKDRIGSMIWRARPTTSEVSSRTRFLSLVADFIVGIPISLPSDENRAETTRFKNEFWAAFLEKEVAVSRDWEAARPLQVLLQEAYEMDIAWKAAQARIGEKFELSWMLMNGINVPIRPRRSVVRHGFTSFPGYETTRKDGV